MGASISCLGKEIISETMTDKHILGVIPARGGSKGIPHKNIRELADKPLIAYAGETGLKSNMITDLILSTDSEEIAQVGVSIGLNVPFIRPKELATDTARTVDVIKHAILTMEEQKNVVYDFCVTLQPTSPLTQVQHIDLALQHLIDRKSDSVISLTLMDMHGHPDLMYTIQDGKLSKLLSGKEIHNRNKIQEIYCRTGNVYAFSRNLPLEHDVLYTKESGFVVIEKEYIINIDDELDWIYAEAAVHHMRKQKNK